MKKEYCVYVHTNKINGKRYVGITSMNPILRWSNGNGYKNNRHFDYAIKKYGWDCFEHEINISELTREQACLWERALILLWDTTSQENGYNISPGGVGAHSVSLETRRKKSRQTKDFFANNPAARKHLAEMGRKQFSTEESKQVVRERMKKMFAEHPEKKTTKAIRQYDLEGNYIRDWESAVIAERECGYDRKKISSCLTGHQKRACGYLWRYADKSAPSKIEPPKNKVRTKKKTKAKKFVRHACGVRQYDRDGNYLKTFKTILEASIETGFHHSSIIGCCKGKTRTLGNYQWRYDDENAPNSLVSNHKYLKRGVVQYTLDGIKVKEYESVHEAVSDNPEIKYGTYIHRVCTGERKSVHGYVWRYSDEIQDKTI